MRLLKRLHSCNRLRRFLKGPMVETFRNSKSRAHEREVKFVHEAEAIRPSPELPPLPQLRLLQTQALFVVEPEVI